MLSVFSVNGKIIHECRTGKGLQGSGRDLLKI
jgi:hypothetical protein